MAKMFLLMVIILGLAGCATSVRYTSYTRQYFPPKPKSQYVNIFMGAQKPPVAQYYVIGKVEISGHAGDGVTPQLLTGQAIAMARKKGADAIINAASESFEQKGMNVIPARVTYHEALMGWHRRVLVERYHPATYIPYSDLILTFKGELAVFILPAT